MRSFIPLFVIVMTGCSTQKPTVPPTPPRMKTMAVPKVSVAPTNLAAAVTLTAQYSQDLTNWSFAGSMTFTQYFTSAQSAFWRGLLTISNFSPAAIPQPVAVLTYHNDNARTGANLNESILTPLNVNTNTFGKLWSFPVDGQVYAQPLYMGGIVFCATEHNNVYAINAINGSLLWSNNLGIPAGRNFHGDIGIDDSVGITGTPVIDSGWLYVDSFTADRLHRIHALNIASGTERSDSPIIVAGLMPGTGDASTNGFVPFDGNQQLQRPTLAINNGTLYVCFGSYGDASPYHGWVFAYNANPLSLSNVFCTTPNGGQGAIWQSGNGPAIDDAGNLYFETGNGTLSAIGQNYGNAFVKLSPDLKVLDYFSPSNQLSLNDGDMDLGSGGCLLASNLVFGCGKEGIAYTLAKDDLGGYSTDTNRIVTQFRIGDWGTWGSPCYFNGMVYFQGCYDLLRNYSMGGALLSVATNSYATYPGCTPSISANGTNNAILWAMQTDDYYLPGALTGPEIVNTNATTTIYAYDAYTLRELWHDDISIGPVKFSVPTIADGRVFIGTQRSVLSYGLK